MDQLHAFASATVTYLSQLPRPAALSLAAFFLLLPLILRRRTWYNAPPGPIGWPILGYLPYLSDRLHEDLFHLAKTYGPLFSLRMGQRPAIVVSSPEMAREVLKHKEASFSSRTITEAVRCIAYDGTSLVFVPYGSRWRLLRKIITSEFFSSRAIELFQPVRRQQVEGLLRTLYTSSKSKTPVNVADSMFVVSSNLTSNIAFSKSLFDTTKKEGRELKDMVWEVLETVAVPNLADMLPFLKVFDPQGLKRRLSKVGMRFDKFLEQLIDERLKEREKGFKKNGKMDMLDVFLDYRSEKEDELKQFSRVDIKGILLDMFMAGGDTTSSTIEWGMTEILKKQESHKKILAELDQVVGKHRFVEESDIPKLTYFQAAVKEVFRLHPAVPLLVPRRTNEACEVSGYSVPKHAILFLNVWGMGRDPKIWPEPCEFKPERFLGSSVDVKGQDFEILPFGTGRRSCVGMPLGHRMVHYSLASLLHAFEWDFPSDVLEDTTEKVGITLQKVKVLIGVPKPRLQDSVYQLQ
ncbi:PREDICTED: geraniol 8-hydroxylase-like [Nelumbo nucifera]|uniref:Geraniol 8-hydroxylase-like n=1 Tax=Nelumbo nucifera TaxID=4432 RepID=A0A1U7Z9T0_NELNU|nr:PREDICTED: geraniol 8-hydroxylase-like [Nelumbo nucifera]